MTKFKVTEPVAVVPIPVVLITECRFTAGMGWKEGLIPPYYYGDVKAIDLGTWYAFIVNRSVFNSVHVENREEIDTYGIGGESLSHCIEQWDKITDGWWAFRSYRDTEGGSRSSLYPGEVVFGEDVKWELWT